MAEFYAEVRQKPDKTLVFSGSGMGWTKTDDGAFRATLMAPARGHGITQAYRDVREFHVVFDHPFSDRPVMQPETRKTARADWIDEEVRELREAGTVFDAADAYLDIAYFAIGGLVEMGINPGPLWQIVHAANMAKLQPDGTVKRREDGKIIKPEGWVPPDALLIREIRHQFDAAYTSGERWSDHDAGDRDEILETRITGGGSDETPVPFKGAE